MRRIPKTKEQIRKENLERIAKYRPIDDGGVSPQPIHVTACFAALNCCLDVILAARRYKIWARGLIKN